MTGVFHKRLRLAVCVFWGINLGLYIALLVMIGIKRDRFPITNWRSWVTTIALIFLFATYCSSVRATQQVNKWARAIPLLGFVGFLLYTTGDIIHRAVLFSPPAPPFFDCSFQGDIDGLCAVDRAWIVLVIAAAALAVVEIVYTLYKGPLDHIRPEPTDDAINTVSPVHYPYSIGPNPTIPYGEVQPQHLQQPLYQQSVYPGYGNNPYPVLDTSSVPLQHMPQHQPTFKYEDSVPHSQYSQYSPQQTYPQQQTYQQPHLYNPVGGAYAQPAPLVSSTPYSGAPPAFTASASPQSRASSDHRAT